MKILVENQEQRNMLLTICGAACKTGDLGIAKLSVVIGEAIEVGEIKELPIEKPDKK